MFIHSLERVNVLNVACQAYQKYIYVEFCEQINCCSLPPEGSLLESGLLLSHWCDPIAYQFSFFPQRETLSCCVNVSPFYVYVNEGGLMEPHLIMKGALKFIYRHQLIRNYSVTVLGNRNYMVTLDQGLIKKCISNIFLNKENQKRQQGEDVDNLNLGDGYLDSVYFCVCSKFSNKK